MVKYVVFDMDGTLLDDDSKLSEENIRMVKTLQEQGIKVGIATGRPWYMVQREMRLLNMQLPVISGNGALVHTKGKETEKIMLDKSQWIPLVEQFLKDDTPFFLHTNEAIVYLPVGDGVNFEKWLNRLRDDAIPSERWPMTKISSVPD